MSISQAPRLSIVVPLRNRANRRLANTLRSLRWQALADSTFEIILSDFGSKQSEHETLEAIAREYGAQIIRTPTQEVWNRSRALNIGIRRAKGHYVLCTDADMIFAPNFLSTLLEVQRHTLDKAFVLCRARDLPEDLAEKDWHIGDLEDLIAASSYRARLGTGACQMATRTYFEKVRGYDEGYTHWGLEDTDMTHRAQRSGLSHCWVEKETAMLHQWHPSNRTRWPLRKTLNDIRFHLTKERIVKNKKSWGLAP